MTKKKSILTCVSYSAVFGQLDKYSECSVFCVSEKKFIFGELTFAFLRVLDFCCFQIISFLFSECSVQAPDNHPEGHVSGGGHGHARVRVHRGGNQRKKKERKKVFALVQTNKIITIVKINKINYYNCKKITI